LASCRDHKSYSDIIYILIGVSDAIFISLGDDWSKACVVAN
jgi:hypothetical protein